MPDNNTDRTVLIADDHEVFRLGLKFLIESMDNITVVGEAEDGKGALDLARHLTPDLVVLDYAMPVMSGLEVLFEVRRRNLPTRVLFLTASVSEAVISDALVAGADGVCLKQDVNEELQAAITQVLDGDCYISSASRPLTTRNESLSKLTPREKQVLILVSRGRRSREIAEDLSLSIKTIEVHRANLMRKLDLHSVAEVIDFANRSGILGG